MYKKGKCMCNTVATQLPFGETISCNKVKKIGFVSIYCNI